MKKIFLLFFFFTGLLQAQTADQQLPNSDDTLYPRNSIRVDVGGKALGGIGFAFERNLKKRHPEKHPRAFTSIEAGISYPIFYESALFSGIGINRNWFLGRRNKWVLNTGIYAGTLIAFNPTPKAIRQMYKDTKFYGGHIVPPVEPWIVGEIGIRYLLERWLFKISFTPVLYYNSLTERFYTGPWAGASWGFTF
jgi:hypothetical protein